MYNADPLSTAYTVQQKYLGVGIPLCKEDRRMNPSQYGTFLRLRTLPAKSGEQETGQL